MFNLGLAKEFINRRGTALEKERLRCLVTGEQGESQLFPIERLQNPDYGFSLHFKAGNPSCINNTGMARACLEDLNLLTRENELQIARFILSCQNRDGIFEDPYETLSLDLPVWMETGTFRFAVYYTVYSCLELLNIDLNYCDDLEKSLNLICQWQKKDGSQPGYLHNSWLSAGVLLLGGAETQAQQALGYLESLPQESWVSSQLLWAMETLINAGLTGEHPLLKKWSNWVGPTQRLNGSFSSEDGDQFNVDVTLEAIRVLKKLGLLELESGVD